MTIERGKEWGSVVEVPRGQWTRGGERELAVFIAGGAPGAFELTHGELHSALGAPPVIADAVRCRRLPIDIIRVDTENDAGEIDTSFATSFLLRRPWHLGGMLAGRLVVVSNVGLFRRFQFSARMHPNDGRVEHLDASRASIRERLLAWSRMRASTFSPSDTVTVRQLRGFNVDVAPSERVFLDGVHRRSVRRITCTVIPDGAVVHVGAP